MKLHSAMLALSAGLSALTVGAQPVDLGPDATGYRRFLLYPHLQKGFEAMARADRVRSLAEFEQAWVLAPDNPVVATYLAEAYRRFGEPARAEAVLRQQLMRNPGDARLNKALRDLRTGTPVSDLMRAAPARFAAVVIETTAKLDAGQPSADSGAVALHLVAAVSGSAPGLGAKRPRSRLVARPQRPDPAYAFADKAYKASASGDHAAAANAAREAVRLAPDNPAYRSLLVYELTETDQLEEADAVASQSLAAADEELAERHKRVRQRIAFSHFEAANKALAAGQADAAAESARQGIRYAPDLVAHRLQLVGILLTAQKWREAEQAASEASRDAGAQPALLVLRAHALQRLAQRRAAAADLDAAVASPGLSSVERKNFRLIAADAALAAGEPQKSLDLLAPLAASGPDGGVTARRALAVRVSRRNVFSAPVVASEWATPRVICVGSLYSPLCDVWPGENAPDPAYAVADAAFRAFAARDHATAVGKAREAIKISPRNPQYRALLVNALMASDQLALADQAATDFLASDGDDTEMRVLRSTVRQRRGQAERASRDAETALRSDGLSVSSEIGMLLQLDRKMQARERFAEAGGEGAFADQPDVETAYLAARVGDDAEAAAAFDRAAAANALPDSALQDAAYAAGRVGQNDRAVTYFSQAIDASESARLVLPPQPLFNARRSVADRSRTWGAYAALTYRGISQSGLTLTPGAIDDTLQGGAEVYWRPFGYGDGRLLEVYGGLSETLYSKAGLIAGAPSVQGALGARVKPLADANLLFALERRVGIGSKAKSDWLARAGYSW
ncbi:MAG: bacteriophage N4 adsorption protein A, partial [Polaromonas sp.]|nr:bacteriophage N4 adsorption protein A [Polaromonas sp.]